MSAQKLSPMHFETWLLMDWKLTQNSLAYNECYSCSCLVWLNFIIVEINLFNKVNKSNKRFISNTNYVCDIFNKKGKILLHLLVLGTRSHHLKGWGDWVPSAWVPLRPSAKATECPAPQFPRPLSAQWDSAQWSSSGLYLVYYYYGEWLS